jgi:hypothetical protein
MAMGSTMAEMVGCVLAQCVSELVRIKVVDWSENGENGESVRANCVSLNLRESPPPNNKNSHLKLHVPELTHVTHEARSFPFGSHSLFPKELRI